MDGWNTTFLLGRPISGAMLVSGRVTETVAKLSTFFLFGGTGVAGRAMLVGWRMIDFFFPLVR